MRNRGWQRFIFCCCHKFPVGPTVLVTAFTGADENSCSDRRFGHLRLCDCAVDTRFHFPGQRFHFPMSKKSLLQLPVEQHRSPCSSQGLGDTREPETLEKPVSVVTESQLATRLVPVCSGGRVVFQPRGTSRGAAALAAVLLSPPYARDSAACGRVTGFHLSYWRQRQQKTLGCDSPVVGDTSIKKCPLQREDLT